MADRVDDLLRLAMFEAWGQRCVWCRRPLHFNEMEVDHLIPRKLPPSERAAVYTSHKLDEAFDLEALENLAPSCGPCNRDKGDRPPPEAPVVATLLRTAAERAPQLRATAGKLRTRRSVVRAITVLRAAVQAGDEHALRAVQVAASEVTAEFRDATGRPV